MVRAKCHYRLSHVNCYERLLSSTTSRCKSVSWGWRKCLERGCMVVLCVCPLNRFHTVGPFSLFYFMDGKSLIWDFLACSHHPLHHHSTPYSFTAPVVGKSIGDWLLSAAHLFFIFASLTASLLWLMVRKKSKKKNHCTDEKQNN